MVSVKKKRQFESWMNRAKRIERGAEKTFTVEGKVYDSAFACYEEAQKLDPENMDVCVKLYDLWPSSDRPLTDWRQLVVCRPFSGVGTQFWDPLPTHPLITTVIHRLMLSQCPDADVVKYSRDLCCLDPENQRARERYRKCLGSSADDCMLYLMTCDYDAEVVGKALDADPGLVRDWHFWQALSHLDRSCGSHPRLQDLLQMDARVSPSGIVLTPSLACKAICVQLENEGRIVEPKWAVPAGRLHIDRRCCPYFQLLPSVRKLSLATHGNALSMRELHRRYDFERTRTSDLPGPWNPKREFYRGEYVHVGDAHKVDQPDLHSALHRKEIGAKRESPLEILASWLRKADFSKSCGFSLQVRDYLSLRFCHGGWPMEPIRLVQMSDVDSMAIEQSKTLALSGPWCHWHLVFFLWMSRPYPARDEEEAIVQANAFNQPEKSFKSTHLFELSLALLDRFWRQTSAGRLAGCPKHLKHHLRANVWQVASVKDDANRKCGESPSRSVRTSLERDELLAVSRVPFTPSWQGKVLYVAQGVDVFGSQAFC